MYLCTVFFVLAVGVGMTYLISVKLQLPAIWNGSAQVIAGIATILGAIRGKSIYLKLQESS